MIIGMRTIKTAFAVTISVSLAYVFNLDSPFFAAIASVMAMQGNLVDSFSTGRNRIFGTILGATIGLIGSLIYPGNPLLIGLGVIIVIYVSNKLKWNKSIVIASVVFISIMVNLEEGSRLYYSLNRVIDTFVGILVAVSVNFFISPPYIKHKLPKAFCNLLEECTGKVKLIALNDGNLSLEKISLELEEIESHYSIFKKEVKAYLYRDYDDIDLDEAMKLVRSLYRNIDILNEMGQGHRISSENSKILSDSYDLKIQPNDELQHKDIVYNYHLKLSLELIDKLSGMFEK